MGVVSRKWIEEHREKLREKYDGKVVIVCEDRVAKVISEPINPIDINEIARKICKGKDWSYTYVCKKEEYLL